MTLDTSSTSAAAASLRAMAAEAGAPCDACATLRTTGWESVSGRFDRKLLAPLGSLPAGNTDACGEATLDEFHPHGTRYWSSDAPIAIGWFPYNRCTAWRCLHCATVFLQYTEYGGYYEEARIRRVDASLVLSPGR